MAEFKQLVGKVADNLTKKEPFADKVTEEKPKLKCPNCKARLTYLAVRSMFYVGRVSGEPHYTNNQNDFRCPFCNHGIAASEELAMERLREGYRK